MEASHGEALMNRVKYAIDQHRNDANYVLRIALHLSQLAGDLDEHRVEIAREGQAAGLHTSAVYQYIRVGNAIARFMPDLLGDPNVAGISFRKWIVIAQCQRPGGLRMEDGVFFLGLLSSADLKSMKLESIRHYVKNLNGKEYAVDPLHLSKIISYVASLSYLKPAEKSTLTDHLQAVNL
jgi:hypothetical protein